MSSSTALVPVLPVPLLARRDRLDPVAVVHVAPDRIELAEKETVFQAAPVLVADAPGARRGLEGMAVLTSERLVIVPGTGPRPVSGDPLVRALQTFWDKLEPALMDAFPVAQLLAEPRARAGAALAGRSRPGVEIALEEITRVFEARVPGWIGIELALPRPDPRPPFAIYLRVDIAPGPHAEWARLLEAQRKAAPPRPELERPYALYYLLRPSPSVRVRGRGPGGAIRGTLGLHADGPTLGRSGKPIVAYESITGLSMAEPTGWRRARLRIEAGAHAWELEPRGRAEVRWLEDVARLISELSGVQIHNEVGHLRAGRVGAAIATAAATGGFALFEILQALGLSPF